MKRVTYKNFEKKAQEEATTLTRERNPSCPVSDFRAMNRFTFSNKINNIHWKI